jgi:hypothetical protein
MYILIYFAQAYVLARCAIDPDYRRRTVARWKISRPSWIVREVGSGVLGIFILLGFAYWTVREVW